MRGKGRVPKKRPVGRKGSQWVADPRQAVFLMNYLNPKSETFGNAYQSALRAQYSEEYAQVITRNANEWLSESVRQRERMLQKAERNLEEVLDLDPVVPAVGMFGPIVDKKTKKPVMKLSPEILKVKHDGSKFVAETIGKKYYSKRHEFGLVDPKDLELPDAERKRIDAIFQENTALPAPRKKR